VDYFPIVGKGISGYLKAIPQLRRKIQEFQPDVIHAHYGLCCLLANLATRSVPVVSTFHGSDINLTKVRPLSKIAMRLSAWNIFVSRRTMHIVHADRRTNTSLIPCGIDLSDDQLQSRTEARKALGWNASDKKILFAGAFDNAVKDPGLAKASVALLNGVELVELKGYNRQQVNALMCACDCLLMTSRTEGSPQVIKEAMACGCPIVSVDVGDVAERIDGVEESYVVKSRGPKDIAVALEKALLFEGKTDGREHVISAGLTNDQIAAKLIDIYQMTIHK
jgi:glycosyltransferase involved in cell wall biosynthesis